MSMTQIVIGAALGCIVAQGGLYGIRQLAGWVQREDVGTRLRALAPSPGPALVAAFVKYAGPVGMAVALITLGVWAVSDYFTARAAPGAALVSASDVTVASASPASSGPPAHTAELAQMSAAPKSDAEPAAAPDGVNPYADPEFKVHRKAHRTGAALSLKETLLARSEAKARADLMKDIQRHIARSQYDCEAGDRAARYLKADLDVWGFWTWESKYFPPESYKGATLTQCKDIKNVVDPSGLDLRSTVAQQNR